MLVVTPPFLGVHVLVAIAKPLSREKFEASVKYFWNLHHQAGRLDPEHELPLPPSARQNVCTCKVPSSSCSGVIFLAPLPRLWVLCRAWVRGCAHLLIEEGICVPSPLLIFHPASLCLFSSWSCFFSHPLAFQKLWNAPHGGHFCPGILINIKKILYSQSLLLKKLTDMSFFSLLGVRPSHKQFKAQTWQFKVNQIPTVEG